MIESPTLTFDFAHLYHLLLSKAWVIILFVILSLSAAVAYLIVGSENLRITGGHRGRAGDAEGQQHPGL